MYKYEDQLCSERLRTRFIQESDINAWTEFTADEACTEFIPLFGDITDPLGRSEHWINRQLTRYKEQTYGLQWLVDKQSGETIGQCGLLLQSLNGQPALEVGYHILKKHWGKGYAPEAAALFLNYAFQNQLADRVISMIKTGNDKSKRVAEKNGLTLQEQTVWNGIEVWIYGVSAQEMDHKLISR